MKKWIKRYIILTICLFLVIFPILAIINFYNVLETEQGRIIFYSVLAVLIIIYYAIMSYFMFKKREK